MKMTLNELKKLIEETLKEGPYDEIDFGFLDKEDEEKNALRVQASETLYNKMAKDTEFLKEIYRLFLASRDMEEAKSKFKQMQYYDRAMRYFEMIYANPDFKKVFGDQEIFRICETTFDKFFSDAYNAAKRRKERKDSQL